MGISWQTIWQTSKVETHIKSMNRYILKFATVAVAVSAQKREFLKCAQIKKQRVTGEVAQEDREWAKENCLKLLGKGKGGKFRGALREAAMQASGLSDDEIAKCKDVREQYFEGGEVANGDLAWAKENCKGKMIEKLQDKLGEVNVENMVKCKEFRMQQFEGEVIGEDELQWANENCRGKFGGSLKQEGGKLRDAIREKFQSGLSESELEKCKELKVQQFGEIEDGDVAWAMKKCRGKFGKGKGGKFRDAVKSKFEGVKSKFGNGFRKMFGSQ